MLQSEYLRRTIAANQVVISRNKVRDSSEQTFIRQAQASKVMPSVVKNGDGVAPTSYGSSRLNGTGGDYTANLQIQIGNAVCSELTPTTHSSIVIAPIQENHMIQPWSQETAAVNYKWMGKQDFFPPKLCSTNKIQYPSG